MLNGSDKLNKLNYPNNINGILDSRASGHFLTITSPQVNIKQQHKAPNRGLLEDSAQEEIPRTAQNNNTKLQQKDYLKKLGGDQAPEEIP